MSDFPFVATRRGGWDGSQGARRRGCTLASVNRGVSLSTSLGILAGAIVLVAGCGGDSTSSRMEVTQPTAPSITSPLGPEQQQSRPKAEARAGASTTTAPAAAASDEESGQKSEADRAR